MSLHSAYPLQILCVDQSTAQQGEAAIRAGEGMIRIHKLKCTSWTSQATQETMQSEGSISMGLWETASHQLSPQPREGKSFTPAKAARNTARNRRCSPDPALLRMKVPPAFLQQPQGCGTNPSHGDREQGWQKCLVTAVTFLTAQPAAAGPISEHVFPIPSKQLSGSEGTCAAGSRAGRPAATQK